VSGGGIRIVPLADTSGLIPTLVDWFEAEWAPWYGPDGKGDARHDLDSSARRTGLPYAVVALGDDDGAIGTAALRTNSAGDEQAPGPWLAAILVAPMRRGEGIGTALVAAIEKAAAAAGYPDIYTSTNTAAGIMSRRGWSAIGETETLRGSAQIFRKVLVRTT
jgi:GNAT superfamily N-acetyltransferase